MLDTKQVPHIGTCLVFKLQGLVAKMVQLSIDHTILDFVSKDQPILIYNPESKSYNQKYQPTPYYGNI